MNKKRIFQVVHLYEGAEIEGKAKYTCYEKKYGIPVRDFSEFAESEIERDCLLASDFEDGSIILGLFLDILIFLGVNAGFFGFLCWLRWVVTEKKEVHLGQ